MVISSRSSTTSHAAAHAAVQTRQSTPALKTSKLTANSFSALVNSAAQQSLQAMGLVPSQAQPSLAGAQNNVRQAAASQNSVTQAASTSSAASSVAATSSYPYRTDVGVYNPTQYATDTTAQGLATLLGGTVTKTAAASGPFNVPQQNMLNFGGGFVANAGLVAQMVQMFGPQMASRMLADQAKVETGGLSLAQNPSMAA